MKTEHGGARKVNQVVHSITDLMQDRDSRIRLIIFAIGFSPIASLSLSTFNLIPLYISGPAIVLPCLVGALILGSVVPRYAQTLVRGFTIGLIAVFLYDLTSRFPFILTGLWPDFIPKVGSYLLRQQHVHWLVGYLWRYIGNGGGMGIAFYAVYPLIKKHAKPLKAGVLYGLIIFCCLLATVYLSPSGRTYLFNPTALTACLGLLGHIVYGFILGCGAKHFPDAAMVSAASSETVVFSVASPEAVVFSEQLRRRIS
ncbi:MAG: hypothetical protein LAO78_26510 [Acidobacteriia bacterium]|nr:hypothetical protein [Terriglobia bacterium]